MRRLFIVYSYLVTFNTINSFIFHTKRAGMLVGNFAKCTRGTGHYLWPWGKGGGGGRRIFGAGKTVTFG